MLTKQNIRSFYQEGFLVVPDLVSKATIKIIMNHLDPIKKFAQNLEYSQKNLNLESPEGGYLAQSGLIKCYKGVLRAAFHLHEKDEFFKELAENSSIYHEVIAQILYGQRPCLFSAHYWGKPARLGSAQPWHQDLAYVSPTERMKHKGLLTTWIALDPAHKDNGCLELYPRSHQLGDLPHLGSIDPKAGEQLHIDVTQVLPSAQPILIELKPGAAVLFDGLLVHGSKANTSSNAREAIGFHYVY